jgi:LysW-gamma-L-lysine carboxypeptidase
MISQRWSQPSEKSCHNLDKTQIPAGFEFCCLKDLMEELYILENILQRYSPSAQEGEAVGWLVDEMNRQGFSARSDQAGNAVGSIGSGPKEIVLLGHIDTVPGFIDVHVADGKLYGRGAVDAKGPLACFTAAVARVGARPGWKLTVIGAVGEEAKSPGAKAILDQYNPEMLIIGEPSGWDHICLGYKGSAWFHYTVRKPLAHTAARTESACEIAVAYWNQLVQWAAERNKDQQRAFYQITPTLRGMRSASDGFTDTAEFQIGFRLPPELLPEDLETAIRVFLSEYGELSLLDSVPPYRAEKNTALVRAFLAGVRAVGGLPAFSLKTGTSDMNLAAPAWGCPSVAYGPGDSNLDHTPNEHIDVAEYAKGIDVLEKTLLQLTL